MLCRPFGTRLFTLVAFVGCTTSSSPGPTPSTVPAPSSKQEMDPLDVLPSKAGEMQIKNAWRISTPGVDLVNGVYEWEGTGATVRMTCSFPPTDKPPCDKSVPTRMKFGRVSACGSSKDEDGTGPTILWRSCWFQADAGVQSSNRFDRLKVAVADAVPWTEKIFGSTPANADMYAILKNRGEGLLAATRRGNVARNLDISHQLDFGR